MAVYTLNQYGFLLTDLAGVGSYPGVAPAWDETYLTRAQAFTIVNTPTIEEEEDLTPERRGLLQVCQQETSDVTLRARFREFTVPAVDAGLRPSIHNFLRACGFIDVHDPGPPYTLTYTLQSYPDTMDSLLAALYRLHSDGASYELMQLAGIRGDFVIRYVPGRNIELEMTAGKGINFAGPTKETPAFVGSLDYDNLVPIRWKSNDASVYKIVGGATYSGPLSALEIRGMMNLSEMPGGGAEGVDEAQLIPQAMFEWDATIERQASDEFNAKVLLDALSPVDFTQALTTSVAGNTFEVQLQGQQASVEEADVGGHMQYVMKNKGVYIHATTPGRIATKPFSLVWKTTP